MYHEQQIAAHSYVLKRSKKFEWMEKCQQAFLTLKEHLRRPPLLSKPIEGEKLYLYLAIFEGTISVALVREEGKIQWLVHDVSKRLLDRDTR